MVSWVRICHAATVRLDAAALRWGLWMERAFLIWVLDSAASGDTNAFEFYGPSSLAAQVPGEFMPEFLVRRNEINGVRLLDRLLNALDDPGELLKAATDFEREIGGKDLSLSMARVMIGGISRVAVLHLRANAELECMIAGVAAERFRAAAGRWPASLDQLTPTYLEAVPVDPFAHGGTIKLARTERGITIYSCGEDREDDGGEVVQNGIHSRASDVGFRLVDPKHRGVMITDEPRPEEDRPSGR